MLWKFTTRTKSFEYKLQLTHDSLLTKVPLCYRMWNSMRKHKWPGVVISLPCFSKMEGIMESVRYKYKTHQAEEEVTLTWVPGQWWLRSLKLWVVLLTQVPVKWRHLPVEHQLSCMASTFWKYSFLTLHSSPQISCFT